MLCHKPPQLAAVAAEVAPHAKAVVSILGGVPLADAEGRLPRPRPSYRLLPNTPVEVRQGAVILAADDEQDADARRRRPRRCSPSSGTLVELPDALVDVAMGLMSNAPAYFALVAEAQIDAGVRHGLTPDQAARARRRRRWRAPRELLRAPGSTRSPCAARSPRPGGSTARGLDALERGGRARRVLRRA